MSRPHRPCEGVACYDDPESESFFVFTSFIADPMKRGLSFQHEIAADFPPLGIDDPRCQEEYFMNFDAARGTLVYNAFAPAWSLVPVFDLKARGFDKLYLSWDFGDQTAIGFAAQNSTTQQTVLYDELYPYRENVATVQRMVYETFAKHHGLEVGSFRINDYLADCVGDPRGGPLAREYLEGELSIAIRCQVPKDAQGSPIVTQERMWRRANDLLAPGFWHCKKRQHPRDKFGGYGRFGQCWFCKAGPIPAAPLLVIMDGRCPNLVRTWGDQVLEQAKEGEIESGKEKRGIEDHAWDAEVKYLSLWIPVRTPDEARRENLLEKPVAALSAGERADRILAQRFERQEEEMETGELLPDGEYVVNVGSRFAAVHDFTGDEDAGFYDEEDG